VNGEVRSPYDLITVGVPVHLHFNRVIMYVCIRFIEDLKLFPKIRYNKLIERLNRYEKHLYKVLNFVFEKPSKVKIADAKVVETKELARFDGHNKSEELGIIKKEESIGYNPSKKDST